MSATFTEKTLVQIEKINTEISRKGEFGEAPDKTTIYDCLHFSEEEDFLTGDDRWYCKKCAEHRDAYKKMHIFKAPKILVIQLKRFI